MIDYFERLSRDVRVKEGLKACMNCGICTAICPAAEFFPYNPKEICNILQTKDNKKIEALLKNETIWYCGQCMSCKARCPRENVPGMLISALRKLSQETGLFVESSKGRQQYAISKTIAESILKSGYCVHAENVKPELHPEQGTVWNWYYNNLEEIADRLGANYKKHGPGSLRLIGKKNLDEINAIFEVTGGKKFLETIHSYSTKKAQEMNLEIDDSLNSPYFIKTYTEDSDQ